MSDSRYTNYTGVIERSGLVLFLIGLYNIPTMQPSTINSIINGFLTLTGMLMWILPAMFNN